MNRTALFIAAALALAAAIYPAPAPSQLNSRPEEQSFDYNPNVRSPGTTDGAAAESSQTANRSPGRATAASTYLWRTWMFRALYIALINLALLVMIISIPKNDETALIVSYTLLGICATLSLWTFLCAILIMTLKSAAWIFVAAGAVVTAGQVYLVMLKLIRSDIAMSELKDAFQKTQTTGSEDPRLASVQGAPSDWPDDDFIK